MKKEESTAVAAKPENALTSEERMGKLNALRNGSGESNLPARPFVPVVQVNNQQETVVIKGKNKKVLCDPNFVITTKTENGDYVTDILGEEIKGTVLLTRYVTEKKWNEEDKSPYWHSFEFEPEAFQNENIMVHVKQGQDEVFCGSYADFKEAYADRYTLSAIVYVLEENTNRLLRFKFKGINRSAYWDYMKLFKKPDTISAHITKFTLDTVDEDSKNYNHVVLTNECELLELDEVISAQQDLIKYFESMEKNGKSDKTTQVEASIIDSDDIFEDKQ